MDGIFSNALMRDRAARGSVRGRDVDDRASNRVGDVVMTARAVIDAVPAGPRRVALKTKQLNFQPIIIEKIHGAGIDQRQKVEIQFGTVLFARLVIDPAFAELLPRPFACIAPFSLYETNHRWMPDCKPLELKFRYAFRLAEP